MNKIVSNSLEDGVKQKVFYNSTKLSQYFNVKDPFHQKYKSYLVYKCPCPQIDCNESYIGETVRHFEEHTNEKKNHIFTNIRVKIVIPTTDLTIFK